MSALVAVLAGTLVVTSIAVIGAASLGGVASGGRQDAPTSRRRRGR